MTAITIRQLPESAKQRLRMRAAAKGRSMEAEARDILLTALDATAGADVSWIEQFVALGEAVGGVDLPVPPDRPADLPDLS